MYGTNNYRVALRSAPCECFIRSVDRFDFRSARVVVALGGITFYSAGAFYFFRLVDSANVASLAFSASSSSSSIFVSSFGTNSSSSSYTPAPDYWALDVRGSTFRTMSGRTSAAADVEAVFPIPVNTFANAQIEIGFRVTGTVSASIGITTMTGQEFALPVTTVTTTPQPTPRPTPRPTPQPTPLPTPQPTPQTSQSIVLGGDPTVLPGTQTTMSIAVVSSTTTSSTAPSAGSDSISVGVTDSMNITPVDVGSTPSATPVVGGVTWGLWVAIGSAICCCVMFLIAAVLLLQRRQRRRTASMIHNPYELQPSSSTDSSTSAATGLVPASQRQNIYANTPSLLSDASSFFGAPSSPSGLPVQSNYVVVPGTLNASGVTIPGVMPSEYGAAPAAPSATYEATTSPLR